MPLINLYTIRLKRFMTSQYIYAGIRMALAIVVPSVILAYFGLLKEYFLFPLGTAFIGLRILQDLLFVGEMLLLWWLSVSFLLPYLLVF